MQGKHIENEKISIKGSDFDPDEEFEFQDFHFHWGYEKLLLLFYDF